MAICYYTCNLLPTSLLGDHGHIPKRLADTLEAREPAAERQTHLCHPMTCPYVVRTLSAADRLLAADPCHCLVVPAGCDAMRRAGDVMEFRHPDQVLNVPIPRELDRNAASALAAHLDHLHGWLAHRRTQSTMTPAQASSSSSPGPGPASISHPALEQPHGVFVVAGPLGTNSVLRLVSDLGSPFSGLESCTGPERMAFMENGPSNWEDSLQVANHILSDGICPRTSTTSRCERLRRRLEQSQPGAILYLRQPFCDPGAYDALTTSRLAIERDIPFLELEIGFPGESSGPIRTRIEAFLETFAFDVETDETAWTDLPT